MCRNILGTTRKHWKIRTRSRLPVNSTRPSSSTSSSFMMCSSFFAVVLYPNFCSPDAHNVRFSGKADTRTQRHATLHQRSLSLSPASNSSRVTNSDLSASKNLNFLCDLVYFASSATRISSSVLCGSAPYAPNTVTQNQDACTQTLLSNPTPSTPFLHSIESPRPFQGRGAHNPSRTRQAGITLHPQAHMYHLQCLHRSRRYQHRPRQEQGHLARLHFNRSSL